METISFIALILLSLVGYSGGAAVRAGRQADLKPVIADLILVLIIWAAAIYTRLAFDFNKWILILLWISASIAVGVVAISFRRLSRTRESIEEESRIWRRWQAFSLRMGSFQSRVLLSFFFFVVVFPFAVAVKVLADPLRIKRSVGNTYWLPKEKIPRDLEEYRRQF